MRTQLRSRTYHLVAAVTLALIVILVGILSLVQQNNRVDALSASADFKAGNIIDDAVFYNKDTMNVQQIQNFLNRLIPSCDTWGTGSSGYGNLTNAQYAQQVMGWPGPPYVCLGNYHENPNTGETSYEKGGGSFVGGISAAQIIYNAAQTYGINPQVLLVLLKKESLGPVTSDSWPLKNQYRYAMGYACPDSGPGNSANCNSQRAGFYNQMTTAAWQLKYYKDNSNSYRYKIGWNDIQYSPNITCGTKQVNIENVATLSLYIYTPYTPNDGSLNNYPGEAHCGAYGNRNFFMFFNEWFGSTRGSVFTAMDMSRKLIANTDTAKINPSTGKEIPNQRISEGQVVEYSSKTITGNNNLCLRTTANTSSDENMCILYRDLNEGPSFSDLPATIALVASEQTSKINPIDGTSIINQIVPPGQIVEYASRTYTFGKNSECLRTVSNTKSDVPACVLRDQLSNIPTFTPLVEPREFVSTDTVFKIDPITGESIPDQKIHKGMIVKYSSQTTRLKDGARCFRTDSNTRGGDNMCVLFTKLKEYVNPNFTNMVVKRTLITNKNTHKIDPITGDNIESLPANLAIKFSQLTYFQGKLCLRTSTDQSLNKLTCVPYTELGEL